MEKTPKWKIRQAFPQEQSASKVTRRAGREQGLDIHRDKQTIVRMDMRVEFNELMVMTQQVGDGWGGIRMSSLE